MYKYLYDAYEHLYKCRAEYLCVMHYKHCHEPNTTPVSYVYAYTYTTHVFINMHISPTGYLCLWCTTRSDSCHEPDTTSVSYVYVYAYTSNVYINMYLSPTEYLCVMHYTHWFLPRTQYVVRIICVWIYIYNTCIYQHVYIFYRVSMCDALHALIHTHTQQIIRMRCTTSTDSCHTPNTSSDSYVYIHIQHAYILICIYMYRHIWCGWQIDIFPPCTQ